MYHLTAEPLTRGLNTVTRNFHDLQEVRDFLKLITGGGAGAYSPDDVQTINNLEHLGVGKTTGVILKGSVTGSPLRRIFITRRAGE